MYANLNKGLVTIPNPYENWIEADFMCSYSLAFFLMLPLLAVFPYGISYYTDMKSGYIKSIITRSKKMNYYVSKCCAMAISAFSVISIPLFLNFFLAATKLPLIAPDISTSTSSIRQSSILWSIYYTHPFVHTILFILIDGLFGVLFTLISFIISDIVENSIVAMLFPFILNVFLLAIFDTFNYSEASSIYFLRSGWEISYWHIITTYVVIILSTTSGVCIFRKVKKDVF
ncbi:MAG: hypothetical protein PUE12_17620 [Oscillospiraceae bacterium]|nr:hypothetical protein [Oscillospiraceae bacterium]